MRVVEHKKSKDVVGNENRLECVGLKEENKESNTLKLAAFPEP